MSQAKWLVCVDWNDDGDFSDANEDVTSDVLGLTLEHFRDLISGRVEAARLEMDLKNDGHKYSPPNGSSPLSGNLKPGRKVWVRAAYPYDAFTDTAGTQLASHTLDYDSTFSWAENLQGFDINSLGTGAETDGTQGSGNCVATTDFGESDVTFGCDFTRGTDGADHGGLCFRYSDTSNYLYVRIDGTNIEVRKVEAGADSQVVSFVHVWAAGAKKFLQVALHGSTSNYLYVRIDGTNIEVRKVEAGADSQVVSFVHVWAAGLLAKKFLQVALHGSTIRVFVDNAEVAETTSTFNTTATRHGLFCDDQADHTWDNFGGWVSMFWGFVDSIRPRPGPGDAY